MPFFILEIYLLISYIGIIFLYQHVSRVSNLSRTRILQQENISYLNWTFVFLAFMVMFRDENIGNDTSAYLNSYISYDPNSTESRYEPGYVLIYKICKFLFTTRYAIIVVTGGVSMYLYYDFIRKYSKWTFMAIMIFVLLGILDSNMNIIRQAIATGFTCYSYKYIVKKNILKFLICVAIASSFHITAILFVFVWLIRNLRITKSVIIFAIGATIILYLGFSTFLSNTFLLFPQYDGYQDSIFGQGNRIGALFQTSIYIILLTSVGFVYLVVKPNKFNKGHFDFLILVCIIGAIIQFLSFKMSIVGRIAMYFNVFQIILVPNTLLLLSRRNRIIISLGILFFLNAYYWTMLLLRPEWNIIYPYKTFLF